MDPGRQSEDRRDDLEGFESASNIRNEDTGDLAVLVQNSGNLSDFLRREYSGPKRECYLFWTQRLCAETLNARPLDCSGSLGSESCLQRTYELPITLNSVQQVSIGRNRVVTPEEIREVDTANLVPESSKRAGYRLDSSSQWVPRNRLLHVLRDWDAEPSTHE